MNEECDCSEALAALEEFLRKELGSERSSWVGEHIDGCLDCSEELKVAVNLSDAVRRACGEQAPDDLQARVLAKIRAHYLTESSASSAN